MKPRPKAMEALLAEVREKSKDAFLVHAPGRVNLMGDHTDYNSGWVLPVALPHGVWLAGYPTDDDGVELTATHFEETQRFALGSLNRGPSGWVEYAKGVAHVLSEEGRPLRGWRGILWSDLPMGSGLSSSAALELAVLRAFAVVGGWAWEPAKAARWAQKAESDWVGVSCGIMDQWVIAHGLQDHALLLDCLELKHRPVAIGDSTTFVVLDSRAPRQLVDSAYNERRAQCEEAARRLGVRTLRDATREKLQSDAAHLNDVLARRAQHVVTENERTLAMAKALAEGDCASAGAMMDASHESLRVDFEVSSKALDTLAGIARRQWGCHGARMTGAGFGGCVVALVEPSEVERFTTAVCTQYATETRRTPGVYRFAPSDGVTLEST